MISNMYRLYAFLFVLSAAFCGTLSAASFPVQVQAGSKTFNCVTDTGIKWEFSSGNATLPATVPGGICAMTVMNLATAPMTVIPSGGATINTGSNSLPLQQFYSATCAWEPLNTNWSCDTNPFSFAIAQCPSDGTTDATSCIQGYLTNYLNVNLPLANACYFINGTLTLQSGQSFWGTQTFASGNNAQICQHSTTADTIFAAASGSGARKVSIHDLQMRCIGTCTAGSAIHIDGNGSVSANTNAEVNIHDVFTVGFYDGLWAAALVNSVIYNNRMSLNGRYGFFVTGTQENTGTTFTSNYSDGAASGCYRIHSLSYSTFISNSCDQVTSGDGYHFQPGQTSGLSITNATWAASVVTFTVSPSPNAEMVKGEQFAVSGVTPTGYNGNDYIVASVSGATVTAALASNPGAYSSGGAFVWGNNIRGVTLVGNGDEFPSANGIALIGGEEYDITGGALTSTTGFSNLLINGANNVHVANSVRMNGGDYCVSITGTPTSNLPVWYWSIVVDHPYCISYGTAMFNDPNRLMQIPQKVQAGVDVATTADLGTITYSNTAGGAGGYGATITNAGSQVAFAADGVTVPLYGSVLVKNQTSTFQNGRYRLTTTGSGSTNWVLTRDPNWSTAQDMYNAAMIPVRLGTTNANTAWLPLGNPTSIGTDAITFGGPH